MLHVGTITIEAFESPAHILLREARAGFTANVGIFELADVKDGTLRTPLAFVDRDMLVDGAIIPFNEAVIPRELKPPIFNRGIGYVDLHPGPEFHTRDSVDYGRARLRVTDDFLYFMKSEMWDDKDGYMHTSHTLTNKVAIGLWSGPIAWHHSEPSGTLPDGFAKSPIRIWEFMDRGIVREVIGVGNTHVRRHVKLTYAGDGLQTIEYPNHREQYFGWPIK